MVLREIDTGHRTGAWNMAADQALLEVQSEKPMPTLRFLSFSPPACLVGYFQAVEQEIRREYCEKKGYHINRRITGGGAIFFDPSQIGWEIIAPVSMFPYPPQKMYSVIGEAVARGLGTLGIKAVFKKRNDIEVGGRKISGMGGVSYRGAFLFQGTLLVQDWIQEMLYSLKVPIEKLKPKEIDSVRERVTCIENELGRIPTREELKNAIRKGLEEVLGLEFRPEKLTPEEKKRIESLLPYFESEEWIYRISLPEELQGLLTGTYRSSFGTIKVNAVVNARTNMLRATYITGDFFIENRESIFDLERLLKNIPFNERKIISTVEKFIKKEGGLPLEDFLGAFTEVFNKWRWVKEGFTPDEANNLFNVNFRPGDKFTPEVFLFPYCAKKAKCPFRHQDECTICGDCEVGEGYEWTEEAGLEPRTVTSFEDLLDNFEDMKKKGINEYIGSCCEAFYVKHQEEFRESRLKGLLVNIENSTCYDLDKATLAYRGLFENKTDLNMKLIKKVLGYIK